LKAPGTKRSKLAEDNLLSSFAFDINLGQYSAAPNREHGARCAPDVHRRAVQGRVPAHQRPDPRHAHRGALRRAAHQLHRQHVDGKAGQMKLATSCDSLYSYADQQGGWENRMARSAVNEGSAVITQEHRFKHARSVCLRHCDFNERPSINSRNSKSRLTPSTRSA